ncbi:MAG: FG-GAP repeat protein [Ignavibacteria bacterium]|nr:FG-GAP repeat protein [Ignavibacteria bacterium]
MSRAEVSISCHGISSVRFAGDVNGDGFDDIIIGTQIY